MRKVFVFALFYTLLLSGCTFGDPDHYTVFIFQGESESWEVQLEYIAHHEGNRPEDKLLITFHGELPDIEAEISVTGSDISERVSFQQAEEDVLALDKNAIEEVIQANVNMDHPVSDQLDIEIRWDGKEEVVVLSYYTAVSGDGRFLWFD
ncbi:hypothetical protein [Jeotgalibacillus salarius]|uniref:DUF5067 domain-containing protein n=1 Tax=Jeotgalibacillus salarius TaxID=546023 RepID=A0A4Y8LJ01_9BACL|nr:hypothetical protein [Jeotgalibacillus salarius]TFE00551.1 hypothetical protein E2626_11275 [Jeotgalibacillus salarius]